ncbi:hypothetical protein CL629_01675 [bacterium]|nr:hypothetical protein [bacterium]|tara:strand:- start:308 stop:1633 length:1326 start_codon:yes stop_codon:yes gene_type:complete
MRYLSFLVFGFIFFGLVIGARVIGDNPGGRALLTEPKISRTRTMPGSSLYFFKEFRRSIDQALSFGSLSKIRNRLDVLDERLGELHELLVHREASPDEFLSVSGEYQNDLDYIRSKIGASEERALDFSDEFLERTFYHFQIFEKLRWEVPEFRSDVVFLEEKMLETAAFVFGIAGDGAEVDTDIFEKNSLPGLQFLQKFADFLPAAISRARVSAAKQEIVSILRGYYLANELSPTSLVGFLIDEANGDFISRVRAVDVLREGFQDEEMKNQLVFLRQKMFEEVDASLFFEDGVIDDEIERLSSFISELRENDADLSEDLQEKLEKAEFTYDRSLEFYSSGLYDRVFSQLSLTSVTLDSLLLDVSLPSAFFEHSVNSLKNEFESLKGKIDGNGEDGVISEFFHEAEENIAELLVSIGQEVSFDFRLISRTKSILVALREALR